MWSASVLIFFRKLVKSDITVSPSVMCMDWLRWWNKHMAHVVSSSTTLAFLTNMNDKHKFVSPSAIQVKNQPRTISIEEKLDVTIWLEKGEQIVDICHNVRLIQSCACTNNYNERIKESPKSETKVFVCVARLPRSFQNEPCQNHGYQSLTFLLQ